MAVSAGAALQFLRAFPEAKSYNVLILDPQASKGVAISSSDRTYPAW